ncbi:MAG: energy transducer TonB [Proteobacteria bacterium]|nr:energy transducer TonB [Pseudomonadota bacterium]
MAATVRKLLNALLSLTTLVLWPAMGSASEAKVHTRTMLTCDPGCHIDIFNYPVALRPSKFLPTNFDTRRREGIVRLIYSVGIDGKVSDVVAAQTIGSPVFARLGIDAISSRSYQPATINGLPVAYRGASTDMYFTTENPRANTDFDASYDRAIALIKGGKPAEAIQVLRDALAQPQQSLYETGAALYELGISLARIGDTDGAVAVADQVILIDRHTQALSKSIRGLIERFALRSYESSHRYLDARDAYDQMQRLGVTPDEDDKAAVERLERAISGADPITVHGTIGTYGDVPYTNRLLRAHFTIVVSKGSIDRYSVFCDVQDGTPSADIHHADMAGWKDCSISVHGAAGTQFDLIDG